MNMLIWTADGWMHQRQASQEPVRLDELMDEFTLWLNILRSWSYKPEFLTEPLGTQASIE